jgi:peptide/nickel transport system permease protein
LDAICWRLYAPYDPLAIDSSSVLHSISGAHWLGTDWLGRDVLSRVLAGATPVLTVAPAAAALGVLGGTVVGLIAGYFGGYVDDVMMRIADALLAFPVVVSGLLVLALLGSSLLAVILVIGAIFTPIVARTVRSAVLGAREQEWVAAARLRGDSHAYIMAIEILPNLTGPIAVEATLRLGFAVFVEASLSFLTLGVPQPSPDWGLSVALARPYIQVGWWVALFPALALATLVVSVFLIVDGVKQVLDE